MTNNLPQQPIGESEVLHPTDVEALNLLDNVFPVDGPVDEELLARMVPISRPVSDHHRLLDENNSHNQTTYPARLEQAQLMTRPSGIETAKTIGRKALTGINRLFDLIIDY